MWLYVKAVLFNLFLRRTQKYLQLNRKGHILCPSILFPLNLCDFLFPLPLSRNQIALLKVHCILADLHKKKKNTFVSESFNWKTVEGCELLWNETKWCLLCLLKKGCSLCRCFGEILCHPRCPLQCSQHSRIWSRGNVAGAVFIPVTSCLEAKRQCFL